MKTLTSQLFGRSFFVPSAIETSPVEYDAQQRVKAQKCIDEGVRAGFYSAAWAAALSTPPTLIICRTLPWAKKNLNHTAQALIISASAIATYFIVSEHTIMECTRQTSIASIEEKRRQHGS